VAPACCSKGKRSTAEIALVHYRCLALTDTVAFTVSKSS
jgi:hypothetical protein